jgi:hypothetical protein
MGIGGFIELRGRCVFNVEDSYLRDSGAGWLTPFSVRIIHFEFLSWGVNNYLSSRTVKRLKIEI